jgi:hypothetical protein
MIGISWEPVIWRFKHLNRIEPKTNRLEGPQSFGTIKTVGVALELKAERAHIIAVLGETNGGIAIGESSALSPN